MQQNQKNNTNKKRILIKSIFSLKLSINKFNLVFFYFYVPFLFICGLKKASLQQKKLS